MSVLNLFKRARKKRQTLNLLDEKSQDVIDSVEKVQKKQLMPEYNMYFEFLDMINGKRINQLFSGSTSIIPINLRAELEIYFNQSIKNNLIYVTRGKESIVQSFTKKELVDILKKNNLPITGNKTDLVERIESNIGLEILYNTGKVSDWIKLTNLGKSTINNYKNNFSKQYDIFQQNIYNLFLLKKVSEACNSISSFKKSYPFNKKDFFITYTDKELFELCKTVRTSDVLDRIGVPKVYHDAILSIMCMYYSFGDFNYEKKIEEIYEGFSDLLIKSDLIKNKDFPFIDFKYLLRGYDFNDLLREYK